MFALRPIQRARRCPGSCEGVVQLMHHTKASVTRSHHELAGPAEPLNTWQAAKKIMAPPIL